MFIFSLLFSSIFVVLFAGQSSPVVGVSPFPCVISVPLVSMKLFNGGELQGY